MGPQLACGTRTVCSFCTGQGVRLGPLGLLIPQEVPENVSVVTLVVHSIGDR